MIYFLNSRRTNLQFELDGKKKWLNINHLYYFFIIVNEGSLTKASEVLLVGPPSLSSQIKQLEINLGMELFERKNRKLSMTQKGQIVYNYAESIFKMAQNMIEAIEIESEDKKQLRVGIPESISKKTVLELCKHVFQDHTYSISIKSGRTQELMIDLKNRSLDLMFANSSVSKSDPTLTIRMITSSPLVICGSNKFGTLTENFPLSLNGAPFILSLPESKIRSSTDMFFKKNGIKIELIGETKDDSMQRIIATEGLALIIAPLSSVEDLLNAKELIEIGRPEKLTEELFLLSSEKWLEQALSQKIFPELQKSY
jgi:LysR family transcriptional activator of nhaA